ncbi:MAG: S1 RNA-binding domain-containing protein [Planctomycetes bacterium]|nr:S1 RNA-binding domain-containing protein [Planctomycetota bacterium]
MTRDPKEAIDAEIEAALDGIDLQSLNPSEEAPAAGGPAPHAKHGKSKDLHPGTVVGVTGPDVFVELGPRMQGVISVSEFETTPKVGETFQFALRGQDEGLWLLSRREALELAAWDEVEVGSLVKAKVTGVNTGGLELRVGPMAAFMPASQVALHRVEDLGAFLNQSFLCQVLEVARERKRIVLSRRAVLEHEREQTRADALDALTVGALVRGKVTRVEKFGAFVEISPGVEGLVHVSNLSRQRVDDPSEFVKTGQDVEAVVQEIKDGGKRIGLSMKALEPDPWDEVPDKYHEGTVFEGTVVRLMEFGAFVELEPGVDGLVHVSQLSRDRVARVRDAVNIGDTFPVRVLSVDVHGRRISLSRLDDHGATLGTEEAADAGAVREALRDTQAKPLGTNLGSLFKKALEGRG